MQSHSLIPILREMGQTRETQNLMSFWGRVGSSATSQALVRLPSGGRFPPSDPSIRAASLQKDGGQGPDRQDDPDRDGEPRPAQEGLPGLGDLPGQTHER